MRLFEYSLEGEAGRFDHSTLREVALSNGFPALLLVQNLVSRWPRLVLFKRSASFCSGWYVSRSRIASVLGCLRLPHLREYRHSERRYEWLLYMYVQPWRFSVQVVRAVPGRRVDRCGFSFSGLLIFPCLSSDNIELEIGKDVALDHPWGRAPTTFLLYFQYLLCIFWRASPTCPNFESRWLGLSIGNIEG